MARGKCAAQSAKRKLDEVQGKLVQVQEVIETERRLWAEERAALQAETNTLRARSKIEVKAMSDEAIRQARLEAAAWVEEARKAHSDQVIAGLVELDKRQPGGIGLVQEDYPAVAEAFGIQVGQWVASDAFEHDCRPRREARRTTNSQARAKYAIINEIKAQGKHAHSEARAKFNLDACDTS